MTNSIGLDKSSEKIPMMDFASITYLPETKSKSNSNCVIAILPYQWSLKKFVLFSYK